MKLFIYANWEKVCKALEGKTIRADEILDNKLSQNWIVIKHDVETNVAKALILAKIEAKYNIASTYYVQADLLDENYKILQEIAKLGHEVTYHYDVLDACDGDMEKSIKSFTDYKNQFESFGFKIKTVCPHGNPIKIRNGWSSNKDFFRNEEVNRLFPHILDIVIHLKNQLDNPYTYVSDAGYSFQEIGNIDSNDKDENKDRKIEEDLIVFLKRKKFLILSTHPHRWESNAFKFILKVYGFKSIRVIAKQLAKIGFFKKIMSKYYYLAKRV